jgi:hypothetical protein
MTQRTYRQIQNQQTRPYSRWTKEEDEAYFREFKKMVQGAGGKAPGYAAIQKLRHREPALKNRSLLKIKSKFQNQLKRIALSKG